MIKIQGFTSMIMKILWTRNATAKIVMSEFNLGQISELKKRVLIIVFQTLSSSITVYPTAMKEML